MKLLAITTTIVMSTTAAHAGFWDVLTGNQSLAELNAEHEAAQIQHFETRAARTGDTFFSDNTNFYVIVDGEASVVNKREALNAGSRDQIVDFIKREVSNDITIKRIEDAVERGAVSDEQFRNFQEKLSEGVTAEEFFADRNGISVVIAPDGVEHAFSNDADREAFLDSIGRISEDDIPTAEEIEEATAKSIEKSLTSVENLDAKAAALAAGDARTAATKAEIQAGN